MEKKDIKKYKKFGKSSRNFIGHTHTLLLAEDHILCITKKGYTETYNRFFYKDLMSCSVSKTIWGTIHQIILAIIAMLIICLGIYLRQIGEAFAGNYWLVISIVFIATFFKLLHRKGSALFQIATYSGNESIKFSSYRKSLKLFAIICQNVAKYQTEENQVKENPTEEKPAEEKPAEDEQSSSEL